ncbi:MAG: hypothetical protein LBI42_01545 [Chitinispirillales bacterium]|jgi:uncharacterized protein involved in exopolysaccharide biosynthesis|nr:hypothetical protein [Chitinispirillales bacterium]
MGINIIESFIAYLYKKRLLLVFNFLIVCVAAYVYAVVILKKEYSATTTFLPPVSEGMSAGSLLGLSLSSLSLGGSSASADQIEVVFGSKAIKRRIINEFDLIKFFKLEKSPNKFELAARNLKKYVILAASEKGGFGMAKTMSYDIKCFHTSPDTVKLMADFTFALLDSAIREISIDKAKRNRVFVEEQITVQKNKMDSLQVEFQNFQNENKAYDVPEQTKLSLKTYADLKSMALMTELRLASLQGEFRGPTHEIAELRRSQRVYNAKLKEFEVGETSDILPSFDRSSKLFPEYAKMLRDIEVQNQLYLFLTKELEQARLQESKDVSPLIIVDHAYVPDYKARPLRARVILIIVFAEHFFFLGFLAYLFAFKTASRTGRFSSLLNTIKQG